ncbi:hypothetical protein [Brenneria corticis]|uniref:hypothetical protein n=1 Tax=Brenneria corticis TaxID=2173106 RepID=UPI00143D294D|nr:hypothetical protein [Brenneria sp. CFCC 11842]
MQQSDSAPALLPFIALACILTFMKREAGVAEPFKQRINEYKIKINNFLFTYNLKSTRFPVAIRPGNRATSFYGKKKAIAETGKESLPASKMMI